MNLKKRILLALGALLIAGAAFAQTTLPPYITGTDNSDQQSIAHLGLLRLARNDAITATPSGTLANSFVLNKSLNVFTVVGTAQDSATLPTLDGGIVIVVMNNTATTMKVWPNSATATINALGAGNGISLVAAARVMFIQTANGVWFTLPLLPS